jgi:outer membrane protein assembly factor BamA
VVEAEVPVVEGEAPPAEDDQRPPGEEPPSLLDGEVPPRLPERMELKVQLAEAALWELTVGPGVVTDFLRLDLALPIAFTHRNLFGEVVAFNASARPAIVLPDCFTGDACFDHPEFGLQSKLGIGVPSFFEEYLRLSIDANYDRDPSQDTKHEEIGGSIGLSRRIVPGLTARIGYNLSFNNYFGSGLLNPETAAEALEESDLRFVKRDLVAYFDVSLVFDRRDSPLDSRNGGFAALSINLAGPYSGSDTAYTRISGDVRAYWTPRFLKWLTLAARVAVGWTFFDGDVGTPLSARFKSGGATSMRGFPTDRIGDFICSSTYGTTRRRLGFANLAGKVNDPDCPTDSSNRTYIGGNYAIESNFELRFHLRGGLGLVAFLDVGRERRLLPRLSCTEPDPLRRAQSRGAHQLDLRAGHVNPVGHPGQAAPLQRPELGRRIRPRDS